MAVEIPRSLLQKVGPEVKMDVSYIDLKLKNGNVFFNMVVRGGKYITGNNSDINGEGELNFKTEDILDIRAPSILKRLFNLWYSSKK